MDNELEIKESFQAQEGAENIDVNIDISEDNTEVQYSTEVSTEEQGSTQEQDIIQFPPTIITQVPSQYSGTGQFVDLCKCEIYEKLLDSDELVIKEATTGYYDPITGQETGNFVTYVIEFGVKNKRKSLFFYYLGE